MIFFISLETLCYAWRIWRVGLVLPLKLYLSTREKWIYLKNTQACLTWLLVLQTLIGLTYLTQFFFEENQLKMFDASGKPKFTNASIRKNRIDTATFITHLYFWSSRQMRELYPTLAGLPTNAFAYLEHVSVLFNSLLHKSDFLLHFPYFIILYLWLNIVSK